jgi:3-isopropylmalate/(R)-2-methylmalate dehydratase small subunit
VKVRGRALVLGDGITTDAIIAGKYCRMADPGRLAPHALEGVAPVCGKRVKRGGRGGDAQSRLRLAGRIIVAGRNFGVGSSREQAPLALKAAGVRAVAAASFGRIFFRNAVNIGLPVLACPGAAAALKDGEAVAVDLSRGTLAPGKGRRALEGERLPPFIMEILGDGGLVPHIRRRFSRGKA